MHSTGHHGTVSDVGLLSCPVCRHPLARDGSRVHCREAHSFDIARAGYVNLTLGDGSRRRVGDTAEMVKARAGFLDAGYLDPVCDAVAAAVAAGHPGRGCLAELGSGTGAHLRAAHDRLAQTAPGPPPAWGFDLSKAAASSSARRHRDLGFVVADVESQIPLLDAAAGAVMAAFAPRPAAECARVLAPGGCLVAAFATPATSSGCGEGGTCCRLVRASSRRCRSGWNPGSQQVRRRRSNTRSRSRPRTPSAWWRWGPTPATTASRSRRPRPPESGSR